MTNLRYAFRSLARSKGFVVVAVLALGLGLGLSTTMFAVLDAIVNPYMPYPDSDNLFRINWWFSSRGALTMSGMYRALKDDTHSFDVAPVSWLGRLPLETDDDSREVEVSRIGPAFFAITGVRPIIGRPFTAGDGDDVALLGEELWRQLHGKTRTLAGTTVNLGTRTYRVVGVMPRGMGIADAWLVLPPTVDPTVTFYATPLVRLKPGVTRQQADAELRVLSGTMTARFATRDRPVSFELSPVRFRSEEIRDIHKAMVGSALLVLVIACVNLAHLMLARGLAKRRELALRMALGAGRSLIVKQMFTECAIITTAGAVLGALGTIWGTDILNNRMPGEVSWVGLIHPQLSWRVFALSAAAAVVSAIVFGLVPAMRVAFQVSLDEPLKDGAGTTGRSRRRYSPLVILEVALALILMMGGGLLLRTIHQLKGIEYTFNARTLLRAQVGLRGDRLDSTKMMRRDDFMALVRSVDGVRDVAFEGGRAAAGGALTAEMVVGDSTRMINTQQYDLVSWQYLRVHGLPILQGRDFEPGDAGGYGKAVINPVAAQRLYPGQNPIGKMIKLGAPPRDAPWIPIIGVFRSPVAIRGGDERPVNPMILVVGENHPAMWGTLLIRTSREDPKIAVAVRRKLHSIPNLWFASAEPYESARNADILSRVFLARVFVTMGTVALALSALGLYGVLAYAVNQRMREFAVRIALGAQPRQLFRMVIHDGMVMLLAGIGIGAFVTFLTSRLLDSVLTQVLPTDVISLVGCEVVLVAAGLAAAFVPARRAVQANPMDILRAV